jgi:hypothetical protein
MNSQHTKAIIHNTQHIANTRDADRRTRRVRLLQIIDHRETQSQRQFGERQGIPSRQRPEHRTRCALMTQVSVNKPRSSSLGQKEPGHTRNKHTENEPLRRKPGEHRSNGVLYPGRTKFKLWSPLPRTPHAFTRSGERGACVTPQLSSRNRGLTGGFHQLQHPCC